MKNNKKLLVVLYVVIFLIYNILIFLIPFKKDAVFYTCYAFTLLAFFIQTGITYFNIKNNTKLYDLFLGLPLIVIGIIYFVIQFILGIIINIIPFNSVRYPILIQILLLLVFALFGVSAIMGKNKISNRGEKVKEKVKTLSSMEIDVTLLINKTTDAELIKRLEKLVDNIKYSDPMSDDSLSSIEENMRIKIGVLKECITDKEKSFALCDEIDSLLSERNMKCKMLK